MPSTSIWQAINITKFNNSPEYKAAKDPVYHWSSANRPDTLVLSNEKSRRLRCVIEREPMVFTVTVPRDSEVDDLKAVIRNRGIPLYVAPTARDLYH